MPYTHTYRQTFWILLAVCTLTIIPFLGLNDFHTKGEPREAIVAYSMIEQGNWILPSNNGGDIPYKPPFFHWCIAAVSLLFNGGNVNEAMSRLPSALALIAMTMACFAFYARRCGQETAAVTALVAFTTFELHRAGMNCRVDMMLTSLTVISLLCLYRWYEKGLHSIPWAAILLMSCATLTKGPVGTIIPCLTIGIFLLTRGVGIFKAAGKLTAFAVMSLVLPMAWYIAAYNQGGKEFLDLAMDENFGRMYGTMRYESHVNPWYYNVMTVAAGYLPWTLLAVISLFTLRYKNLHKSQLSPGILISGIREMSPVSMFSLVSIVTIFLFYCFPESKRSVYLMPIYPFIAYFLAQYLFYLVNERSKSIKIYGGTLAAICILLPVTLILAKCGAIPDSIFKGRHAALNAAMLHNIADIRGVASMTIIAITTLPAAGWWIYARKRLGYRHIYAVIILTFGLYLSLDGVYQPAALNTKSVKEISADIDRQLPESEGTLYEFISDGVFSAGNPVHFFEINFYLGNRVGNFYKSRPESGFLLINDFDAKKYLPEFSREGYTFENVYKAPHDNPVHKTLEIYRFDKENATPN